MWMVQRGEHLRFALEPRETFWVGCEEIGQHFEGDVATELCVVRPVDFAHPARTKQRDDFVRTETNAGREGHWTASRRRDYTAGGLAETSSRLQTLCLRHVAVDNRGGRREPVVLRELGMLCGVCSCGRMPGDLCLRALVCVCC